jgi:hypothetical protein
VQIEIHGREAMLEQIRLRLQDELERNGYKEGPKVSSMDAGVLIDYLKGDLIVSIQVTLESEAGESILHVECEQEVPELEKIWDTALIHYGREVLEHLRNWSLDKDRINRELK